jgi:serine/threonine protein kinase
MTSNVCWICGNTHPPGVPCTAALDCRIGTLLDGKYTIKRELGAGGMGKVYEAQHAHIGRRVAIKFLLPEYAAHPEIVRRFENEARAAGSLEHENIAAVLDFGQTDEGARYLVMEFLAGQDCEKVLSKEGPLPVTRAVNIVLQVCRGLSVAHQADIVHRDLKPANLFLIKRPDRSELVKILDFGIAKLRKANDQPGTVTGLTLGTPYYMSPEQARGDKNVDLRTDVYALGVILYELLSATRPYEGNSFLEIINSILHEQPPPLQSKRQGLPDGLVDVVRKAMHRDLSQRVQTVADLGEALIPFAGMPVVSFHSQPAAVAVADTGENTLASGAASVQQTASTTAPVTPKTRARFYVAPGSHKARWLVMSGALAAVAVLAVYAGVRRSRVEPAARNTTAGSVPFTTSSTTSGTRQSAVSPAAVVPVSEHLERPDSGVEPSLPDPIAEASSTRAKGADAKGTKRAQRAEKTEKVVPPAASSVAAAPPAPAPTPVPTPASHAIDISREPNF